MHGSTETPTAVLTVDPTGTSRRLQALFAIGYNERSLLELYLPGWSRTHLVARMRGDRPVPAAEAALVARVYEPLSGLPAPCNPALTVAEQQRARATASHARSSGAARGGVRYLPPLAWEDCDIDDPAAVPDTSGLIVWSTRLEPTDDVTAADDVARFVAFAIVEAPDRVAAGYAQLPLRYRPAVAYEVTAATGKYAWQVAELLGVTTRTVVRLRARHRAQLEALPLAAPLAVGA